MKILFVADTYYPHVNGVYCFVERLAGLLKAEGHSVAVVAPSATRHYTRKEINKINIFGVPSFSILFYNSIRIPIPFFLEAHLDKILTDFTPDIIHLQNHFSLNKAMIRANRKYGLPLIATNHFMSENLTSFLNSKAIIKVFDKWLWRGFSKTFNKVSVITAPSETAANMIRPRLNVSVVTITNGINLNKYCSGIDSKFIRVKYAIPDRPILLYVGRLDPEKNIDEILRAIALQARSTNFCFVIAGKGIRRNALERLSKKLKISDRVIFTGYVPDEDLVNLYQCSRCFIMASIAELQSLATLEAMATGLPVIAARAGALPELVRENENGYLFSPGDIVQLAQCIQSVFTNHALHSKMSVSSLTYASEHNIAETVDKYSKLYQTTLKKSKAFQLN